MKCAHGNQLFHWAWNKNFSPSILMHWMSVQPAQYVRVGFGILLSTNQANLHLSSENASLPNSVFWWLLELPSNWYSQLLTTEMRRKVLARAKLYLEISLSAATWMGTWLQKVRSWNRPLDPRTCTYCTLKWQWGVCSMLIIEVKWRNKKPVTSSFCLSRINCLRTSCPKLCTLSRRTVYRWRMRVLQADVDHTQHEHTWCESTYRRVCLQCEADSAARLGKMKGSISSSLQVLQKKCVGFLPACKS